MAWTDQIRQHSQDLLLFLPRFVSRPIEIMKHPPEWDWTLVIGFQTAFAAAVGLVAGLLAQSFWSLVANLFLFPISALLISAIFTVLIYVLLQSHFHVVTSLLKVSVIVMCAQIPLILFRVLSPFGIPHDLIGVGAALALLTVGLVENFRIPKHRVIRWTAGAYGAFFFVWIIVILVRSHSEMNFEKRLQPAAIEQLEKNLSK